MNTLSIVFILAIALLVILLSGKGAIKQFKIILGGFGVLILGLLQCKIVDCDMTQSLLLESSVSPGIVAGCGIISAGLIRLAIDSFRDE